jgi:hypothetical protein
LRDGKLTLGGVKLLCSISEQLDCGNFILLDSDTDDSFDEVAGWSFVVHELSLLIEPTLPHRELIMFFNIFSSQKPGENREFYHCNLKI